MDTWTFLTWAAWVLRRTPGGHRVIRAARARLLREPFRLTHTAIHTVREIRAFSEQVSVSGNSQAIHHLETLSEKFCNQATAVLASLTATDPLELHCCVKLIEPGTTRADDIVRTFSRSSNSGSRSSGDRNADEVHRVGECSVWASIHALSDGKNNWAGLPCFSCPDLASVGDKFVCSRKDWKDRYRSTIALPIRYSMDGAGCNRRLVGFLAFDTKNKSCLSQLPNAFDFVEKPQAFEEELRRSPIFDALAGLTDSYGTALATLWETSDNATVVGRLRLPVIQPKVALSNSKEENG